MDIMYLPPVRPVAKKSDTLLTRLLLNSTMPIISARITRTIVQSNIDKFIFYYCFEREINSLMVLIASPTDVSAAP